MDGALRGTEPRMSRYESTTRPQLIQPAGAGFYLTQAEACRMAAGAAATAEERALHQEECKLWLILAEHRRAIDTVLESYLDLAEAA